jgi:hypothetical protein
MTKHDKIDWDPKPRAEKKQPEYFGDRASTSRLIRGKRAPLTRQELRLHSNAYYGHRHMQLPDNYEAQLKKYHAAMKAHKKAHGQGGRRTRRHRKSRSTRRR